MSMDVRRELSPNAIESHLVFCNGLLSTLQSWKDALNKALTPVIAPPNPNNLYSWLQISDESLYNSAVYFLQSYKLDRWNFASEQVYQESIKGMSTTEVLKLNHILEEANIKIPTKDDE